MSNIALIENLKSFKTLISGMNHTAFNQHIESFKRDINGISDAKIRNRSLEQLEVIAKHRIYVQGKDEQNIERGLKPEIWKLIHFVKGLDCLFIGELTETFQKEVMARFASFSVAISTIKGNDADTFRAVGSANSPTHSG